MDFSTNTSIQKISNYYNLEVAEVASEAWLLSYDFPELSEAELMNKVRSACIDLVKSGGVSSKPCEDVEEFRNDYCLNESNVLDVLIKQQEEAEMMRKIDSLDSLTRARLDALSACSNGADFGKRLGKSKRSANECIQQWCIEADLSRQAQGQAELFA